MAPPRSRVVEAFGQCPRRVSEEDHRILFVEDIVATVASAVLGDQYDFNVIHSLTRRALDFAVNGRGARDWTEVRATLRESIVRSHLDPLTRDGDQGGDSDLE